MTSALLSPVGHRVREAGLLLRHLSAARRRPVILISVADTVGGYSSDLRGKRVVAQWRAQGLNALLVPAQLECAQRHRIARLLRPDVVIHQTFRVPGNDPGIYPGAVNILDLDDADFQDERIRAEMERRIALCDGGIGGSRYVRDWIAGFCAQTCVIYTGAPPVQTAPPPPSRRPGRRLLWARADSQTNGQEAQFLREVLGRIGPDCAFELVVVGNGDTSELREFFAPVLGPARQMVHHPFLPYPKYLAMLATGHVGLAPLMVADMAFSRGKSFGKILGYLAAGVPVIASDAADHDQVFRNGENGYIGNDPALWATQIRALLDDPQLSDRIAAQGRADLVSRLSLQEYCRRARDFIDHVHRGRRGRALVPPRA